ncbi:transcription repressor OFP14 [Silene latifolia]|uniref:transcription repressor OFP14 n=1 Tax=Silene latifolia TaxID=37657 RepID=UPI003D775602
MPKNIQKTIHNYISKIKKQAPHLQISHSSLSHTTSKLLSGCKHPKSLSYDFEHKENQQQKNDEAATLEDIDRFLIENFKSLYGHELGREEENDEKKGKAEKEGYTRNGSESSGVLYDSPRFFTPPVDLNNGSYRFLASQASSGSLLEETRLSGSVGTSTSDEVRSVLSPSLVDTMVQGRDQVKNDKPAIPEGIDDCIAVLTVSPSPYEDFRRSMLGVLEARIHHNQRVDWDFMQELLFCYLRLNEKKQYRFILSAFVDLVVVLRQNSSNGKTEGSQSSDGDKGDVKGKKRGGY